MNQMYDKMGLKTIIKRSLLTITMRYTQETVHLWTHLSTDGLAGIRLKRENKNKKIVSALIFSSYQTDVCSKFLIS